MSMGKGQSENVHTLTLVKAITECAQRVLHFFLHCTPYIYRFDGESVIETKASSICHVYTTCSVAARPGPAQERASESENEREREISIEKRTGMLGSQKRANQSAFEMHTNTLAQFTFRINVCTIIKQYKRLFVFVCFFSFFFSEMLELLRCCVNSC